VPLGRVPSLVLPFAAAGVATLVFFAGLDGDALPFWASAIAGGAVGVVLTRFCRRSERGEVPRRTLWVRLVLSTLAAGAVFGLVVGAVEGSPSRVVGAAVDGAFNGVFGACAGLPLLATVLGLALCAERSRHGSIVARSDRRAVPALLTVVFALLAARDAGTWHLASSGEVFASWDPWAVAVAAAALAIGLFGLDVAALFRVTRIARDRTLSPLATPGDTAAPPGVDLGLGDESVGRLAHGAAYRSVARPVDVVLGSLPDARRAIRFAVVRDLVVVLVAGATALAHAQNRTEGGRRAAIAWFAHAGEPVACLDHARWLEARDGDGSRAEVTHLYDLACRRAGGEPCAIAAARNEADGDAEDAAVERSRMCDVGDVGACHAAGALMLRAWISTTLAFDRLQKACKAGIGAACCEGAYLAYLGEGSSWVLDNEHPGHDGLWGLEGVADPATDARFAQDLYASAVTQGHGGDALCVELRDLGFVE
jgi:hypothetical protein